MSPDVTLPITLYPRRAKYALLFLVCALFVAMGILMIQSGKPFGYLTCAFFGIGLPVFVVQLIPGVSYLRLDRDGFTFCALFRSHFVEWSHVTEFGVINIGAANRRVAWNYSASAPAGRGRGLSKALAGYEAAIPDTYGMKPQDLADWLNRLRVEYSRFSAV